MATVDGATAIGRSCGILWLTLAMLSVAGTAMAQNPGIKPPEDDHAIVFELGAAGDWSRAEGFHPGGTFAFEVTPIENWLELEVGATAIRADSSTEIPVDLLFKKPWRFSPQFEFMIGVGPELIHATGGDHATYWALSSVLDFMFWRRKNVGWYIEPGYELTFRDGTTRHGIAIAGGVLIGR
jgi:hypothetical protein